MIKILIIEDEEILALGLKTLVEKMGFEAVVVNSGNKAINQLMIHKFHVVLTDIMMDDGDGFEVLKYIKNNDYQTCTYVISALNTDNDQIKAYDYQIIDYIIKPFNYKIIERKLFSFINREFKLNANDYEILNGDVVISGNKCGLTQKEFELFCLLTSFESRYFTKYDLLNELWYENMDMSEKIVEVNISKLRKKLGILGNNIKTKRGFGYTYEKN